MFDNLFSFASFLGLLSRRIDCDDLNYFYFCFFRSSLNSMKILSFGVYAINEVKRFAAVAFHSLYC